MNLVQHNPKYKSVTELVAENPNLLEYLNQLEDCVQRRAPEYKPSLMCRILGHKWWLTSKTDTKKDGEYWTEINHKQAPNCDRCGVANPAWNK